MNGERLPLFPPLLSCQSDKTNQKVKVMAHVKPREGSTLEKPPAANPGELDANLTMLLLLGAGDFSGKKGNKHRNVLGQVLVSSAT